MFILGINRTNWVITSNSEFNESTSASNLNNGIYYEPDSGYYASKLNPGTEAFVYVDMMRVFSVISVVIVKRQDTRYTTDNKNKRNFRSKATFH